MEYGPEFWVALSFVLLVVAAFKPVGKVIINALDGRSAKIQKELDEALKLREEAQELLASYQRKQKEAAEEALKIITNAENETKRIILEAEKNLEESLNNKIQIAMQKIATYEHSVMQEVRTNSIDIAIGTVRNLIKEKINNEISEKLVTSAVNEMNKKLN